MKTRTALVTLAATVALVLVGTFVAERMSSGPDSILVTANFDNAAGLYEGNDVSVLGIPIGRIVSIDPTGTHVAVGMEIDAGTEVPADVRAVAVSTSVLTDRHIELTPAYDGGAVLDHGATIGLEHTRTPIEFDRLLAMADTMAVELAGDGQGNGPVSALLDVGVGATAGNGVGIKSALGTLSQAMALSADRGAGTRNSITAIVDNLSVLSSAAAANDADIREFGEATKRLSEVLAESNLGAGTTGSQINEILQQADLLLQNHRDAVRSTVTGAQTVTRALADYRNEVGEFLDLTPLLMDNAYNAIDQETGAARVHAQLEKVFFDGELVSQVCNLLEVRDLGCTTGTVKDFGPGFGIASMLEGIAGLPR